MQAHTLFCMGVFSFSLAVYASDKVSIKTARKKRFNQNRWSIVYDGYILRKDLSITEGKKKKKKKKKKKPRMMPLIIRTTSNKVIC
ncbi:hypothetical protein BDF20DRAFT_228080 [Mycotypha africana]|uniref:uncharacterized protein n=1 Tax=Mycotypha africana TaxID=64632 RepID=UPI002301B2E8|nr:uncharacterized protein BDF20DRAFT_228080 [Mycotypha africana]KAI8967637.1 hypothetical protein BDF20DRAFT_228080 [Mycotypha africana]